MQGRYHMDIEITDEMLDAGLYVLGLYDPEWDSAQEVLKKAYRAMRDAEAKAVPHRPQSKYTLTPGSPHC